MAARHMLKTAGITEEEFADFEAMTDADIDAAIYSANQQIKAIEWRKKMRQTPFERRANRLFETEDAEKELDTTTDKIVIDRVPPKVRKDVRERGW